MAINAAPVKYDAFALAGGVDLVTPTMELKPGVARDALNYEVSVSGGYTRVLGYERFDGRAAPSAASVVVITLSAVAGLAAGNSIVNAGATASGTVISIDANNNVIYTLAVGAFVVGDTIKVGGTTIGTYVATTNYAPTAQQQATNIAAAADAYRTLILVVPGSGPIRGVVNYNGAVYAWRNNAGGTALAIYKSTATGWVLVPLGYELAFNTGVGTTWNEGDVVYGNTSAATGTVARVALSSGTSWVGGSGRLILSVTAGTFTNGEVLKLTNAGGVAKATCGGPAVAIVPAAGGRVETVKGTFGSGAATRVYGADGVNRAFEFDGAVYAPITTGMPSDAPTHVVLHKNYLWLSFGCSVQNSGVGTPNVWSPVFGANEFVLPEPVTGFLTLPGTTNSGSLAIFSARNTFLLYGTGASTWNLVTYNTGLGAATYTPQMMENVFSLGDRGVNMSESTQAYGNFNSTVLTLNLRPFIQARRSLASASAVNREKSQYRNFYSDGYALYTTIVNGEVQGSMPVLFPDPVNVWCEGATVNGPEVSYFGGTMGYVYTLDQGTSFDGAAIPAYIVLNFNSKGAARVLKRYRKASIEIAGSGYADFAFTYALGYGSTSLQQAGTPVVYATPFALTFWDSFVWDSFVWDGTALAPSEVECIGTAENIAVTISSNSKINSTFTVNSITLHYTPRRGIR